MLKNNATHYGSVSKFLHWLLFFMIVGLIIVGFIMGGVSNKAVQGQMFYLHKLIGLLALLLAIFSLLWSLLNPKPLPPPTTPLWERLSARLVHFSLYLALIIQPLSGWISSTAAGYPPTIFGSLTFPFPVSKNKQIANFGGGIHYYLAWIIVALICIHILAAIKHHFFDKDYILKRMLPRFLQKR